MDWLPPTKTQAINRSGRKPPNVQIIPFGETMTQISRYEAGDGEKRELPYVLVGDFRPHTRSNKNPASVDAGVMVYARPLGGGGKDFFVPARSQREPDTKNKIGTLGAYRDMPPSDEAIEKAVQEAQDFITRCQQSQYVVRQPYADNEGPYATYEEAVAAADKTFKQRFHQDHQVEVVRAFDNLVVYVRDGIREAMNRMERGGSGVVEFKEIL